MQKWPVEAGHFFSIDSDHGASDDEHCSAHDTKAGFIRPQVPTPRRPRDVDVSTGAFSPGPRTELIGTRIGQEVVGLKRQVRRRKPLRASGCPSYAALADWQVQEADQIAHLLLSQLVRPTWAATHGGFVQRIKCSQTHREELAIHDPFSTALDISEPQPCAEFCNAGPHESAVSSVANDDPIGAALIKLASALARYEH
jgi:hypothetical protein